MSPLCRCKQIPTSHAVRAPSRVYRPLRHSCAQLPKLKSSATPTSTSTTISTSVSKSTPTPLSESGARKESALPLPPPLKAFLPFDFLPAWRYLAYRTVSNTVVVFSEFHTPHPKPPSRQTQVRDPQLWSQSEVRG